MKNPMPVRTRTVLGMAGALLVRRKRGLRAVGLAVMVGLVLLMAHPRAQQPPATFTRIGDLPGGSVGSIVRDATKVNGVIYAVGASTKWDPTVPSGGTVPRLDAAIQWNSTSGISEIPDIRIPLTADPMSANATGHAITADGDDRKH